MTTTPSTAPSASPSAALQTHLAPRTRSFAARPEGSSGATTATISPAALAASKATPEPAAPPTPMQKAYRTPAA